MRIVQDKPGRPERRNADRPRSRRLRAVAVLPTLATLGNLFCGFAAIHFCMRALYSAGSGTSPLDEITLHRALFERLLPSFLAMSGYMIFLAMIFDVLDGRLARLARRTTTFGGQLDSAADMVSFGLAPAVLVVTLMTRQLKGEWLITPLGDTLGRAAWIAAALFVACAAVRLARFNVENEPGQPRRTHFKGLPTPGAAAVMASLVILHEWLFRIESTAESSAATWSQTLVKTMPVVAPVLGLLMVSRIRYIHVGNTLLRGRRPLIHVLIMVMAVLLILLAPEPALTGYLILYALSGPAATVVGWFRKPIQALEAPPVASPGQHPTGTGQVDRTA